MQALPTVLVLFVAVGHGRAQNVGNRNKFSWATSERQRERQRMPEDALASILLGLNAPKNVNDLSRRPVLQSIGGALVAGFSSPAHAAQIQQVTPRGEKRAEDTLNTVTVYEELTLGEGIKELDRAVKDNPAAKAGVDLYKDVMEEFIQTKCGDTNINLVGVPEDQIPEEGTGELVFSCGKSLDFKKFADGKFWDDKLKALTIEDKYRSKVVAATDKLKAAAAKKDIEEAVVQMLAVGEAIDSWAYTQS